MSNFSLSAPLFAEVGFLRAAVVTFFLSFVAFPIFLGIVRFFGLYAVVEERTCRV